MVTELIGVKAVVQAFCSSAWFRDEELGRERVQGIFDSPNQVGEVNMITIGAALACWNSMRGAGWKIAVALLIAVSVALMVVADSRSSAVAIVVSMAALAIWHYRWRGVFAVMAGAAPAGLRARPLKPQAPLFFNPPHVAPLTRAARVL